MTVVGKVKLYDLVDKNLSAISNTDDSNNNSSDDSETRVQAAWEVVAPAPGFEVLRGWFGFREYTPPFLISSSSSFPENVRSRALYKPAGG